MERVAHLWNVGRAIAKLNCEQARDLQSYYTECCKNFSDAVKLPGQRFGPSVMCSHCGLPWGSVERSVRILPGRKPSKSVQKLINTNRTGSLLPKVRKTLMEKSAKNQMNRIAITCSFCSKTTHIKAEKPKRVKPMKVEEQKKKKKKKKGKDKTAGLNISGLSTQTQSGGDPGQTSTVTPKNVVQTKLKSKTIRSAKPKKLNINKLKNIVNQGMTTPNRKSLQNFLKELY